MINFSKISFKSNRHKREHLLGVLAGKCPLGEQREAGQRLPVSLVWTLGDLRGLTVTPESMPCETWESYPGEATSRSRRLRSRQVGTELRTPASAFRMHLEPMGCLPRDQTTQGAGPGSAAWGEVCFCCG